MKVLIVACLVVVAVSGSFLEEYGIKFQAFKLKHNKTYLNQAEETKRYAIFKDNLRSIEQHNALYAQGLSSYKQGINQFTDLTQEEFKAKLAFSAAKRPLFNATQHVKTGLAFPASVDWRTQGQVTEIKDQGDCGSDWAFSLTGSIEAAYYRSSGHLLSFSEQQLIDCSTDINFGCEGGYLDHTILYIYSKGLQTDSSYPYTGTDDSCKYNPSNVRTRVAGYHSIASEDEVALRDAVAHVGPISVTMDATYLSAYDSGIYEDKSCTTDTLNHAVLIVGYGVENNKKYWIVKNSWGSWGEKGFFRIARGKNECGISEDCLYPVI